MLPAPDPTCGVEPGAVVDALVAVALDDLDEGRLTVEAALHAVAVAAWRAGRAEAPTV